MPNDFHTWIIILAHQPHILFTLNGPQASSPHSHGPPTSHQYEQTTNHKDTKLPSPWVILNPCISLTKPTIPNYIKHKKVIKDYQCWNNNVKYFRSNRWMTYHPPENLTWKRKIFTKVSTHTSQNTQIVVCLYYTWAKILSTITCSA